MTIPLDNAAKDFQEKLRRRGSERKALALKAVKQQRGKASTPELLAEMRAQLDEIHALLKQGKSGPVKFVVTERDSNGEIKSFQVEP